MSLSCSAHTFQLKSINNVAGLLTSIRRAYLNVEAAQNTLVRPIPRSLDLGATSAEAWASIKYLNNEQRDAIDLHARNVFSRCADRVKEMEAIEKRMPTLSTMYAVIMTQSRTHRNSFGTSQCVSASPSRAFACTWRNSWGFCCSTQFEFDLLPQSTAC